VLQPSDHFCGPPLDPLQQVHVFPVLRAPELDAGLQVRCHQSRVDGQNPLPRPAGHAAFDAAQDMVGLLGCERTLLEYSCTFGSYLGLGEFWLGVCSTVGFLGNFSFGCLVSTRCFVALGCVFGLDTEDLPHPLGFQES